MGHWAPLNIPFRCFSNAVLVVDDVVWGDVKLAWLVVESGVALIWCWVRVKVGCQPGNGAGAALTMVHWLVVGAGSWNMFW